MLASRRFHPVVFLLVLTLAPLETTLAQRHPSTVREFLLPYKGQEILMMDRTGGAEQFAGGEAAKAYTLVLDDVMADYIVVSRDSETDKRTFLYPLSVIRRIIFMYDGKPYKKIVLEMY
jgi:hypothetical protein